jgi:hypothetical protein
VDKKMPTITTIENGIVEEVNESDDGGDMLESENSRFNNNFNQR